METITQKAILLGVVFLVFTLTLFLVEVYRKIALKKQILDVPNDRSSHVTPTPRGGGIVIVVVSMFFSFLLDLVFGNLPNYSLYISLILVSGVSFIDDQISLSAITRLLLHFASAFIFVLGNGYISTLYVPILGTLEIGFIGAILTVLWIVWMTNAYNFMDGIDGIAAGTGVVSGVVLSAAMFASSNRSIAYFPLLIAGGCAAFLYHNWNPARIFLGDVGSAFLGFALASLPIVKAPEATIGRSELFIVSAFSLLPFFADTTITFARRVLLRENFLSAHRTHFYQKLSDHYKQSTVTSVYILCSLFFGLVGLAISRFTR